MIKIDTNTCIGCGLCVEDCLQDDIELRKGKAHSKEIFCMECGHCLAICPTNAITLLNYPDASIVSCGELDPLDPEQFMHWVQTRRSIRQFTKEPLSEEDLQKILLVGAHSPTGGNLQDVSYIVIERELAHVRKLAVASLYALSDRQTPGLARYQKLWKKMYEEEQKTHPVDRLFFGAPCVILVLSPSAPNALIAAAHMETMIYAMGLGMLYSGFTTRAIHHSEPLKEFLGMKTSDTVQASLVVGHPKVRYVRSAPRKLPRVLRR